MRRINSEVRALTEAFRAGKAAWVVGKLGKILERRLGKSVVTSTVPIKYENDYGSFAGYFMRVGMNLLVKINFQLTKADTIYSYDVYLDEEQSIPSYTVDVYGLNIVEIVNTLIEDLIDDGEADPDDLQESYVRERGPGRPSVGAVEDYLPMMEKWVDQQPDMLDVLQKKSMTDVYSKHFAPWAKDKPNYAAIKYYLFVKIVKRFLLERGMTNKTFRKRKKGSKERQVEDPILQSQLEDIAEGISWKEKFEFLRGMIAQMVQGRIQSIYLYGDPGCLGKSTRLQLKIDNKDKECTIQELHDNWNSKDDVEILSYNASGHLEYKRVKGVAYSGRKEVFEITTQSGKNIVASKDHKFVVEGNDDFLPLSELKITDKLLVQKVGGDGSVYDLIKKIKSVGEEDTYDIEMADWNQPTFVAQDIVVHNSGKSFETMKTLDELLGKGNYTVFSGAAKPEEFVQILYNHRQNEILVLDDFSDKLLKNTEIVNVLKAALQNEKTRTITYGKVAKKGLDYPPQFDFESGIIFISNYSKLDGAIASRSMVLEITLSNEEALEKVETTLENFHPEVDMATKRQALEYAKELAPGVKSIDYRMVDNILVAIQVSPNNWKRMALMLMQSVS